jgi:hypothetical protein
MPNRFRRLTPDQLSEAMDCLKLSANELARLGGHQRRRVLQWLEGQEEVPHHIAVLLAMWFLVPETLDRLTLNTA